MIDPTETSIVGQWLAVDGRMQSNDAEKRIHALISGDLEKLSKDKSGWEILYRDPSDGRYWEMTFPHSGMQGRPRKLDVIDQISATQKYKISVI